MTIYEVGPKLFEGKCTRRAKWPKGTFLVSRFPSEDKGVVYPHVELIVKGVAHKMQHNSEDVKATDWEVIDRPEDVPEAIWDGLHMAGMR